MVASARVEVSESPSCVFTSLDPCALGVASNKEPEGIRREVECLGGLRMPAPVPVQGMATGQGPLQLPRRALFRLPTSASVIRLFEQARWGLLPLMWTLWCPLNEDPYFRALVLQQWVEDQRVRRIWSRIFELFGTSDRSSPDFVPEIPEEARALMNDPALHDMYAATAVRLDQARHYGQTLCRQFFVHVEAAGHVPLRMPPDVIGLIEEFLNH